VEDTRVLEFKSTMMELAVANNTVHGSESQRTGWLLKCIR